MAILDSFLQFTDSGDAATEPGTSNLGDVIDLGSTAPGDISLGEPLYLHIYVVTAADGGGTNGGTTSFIVASDSTATLATDGNQTIHLQTPAYAAADLPAGAVISHALPTGRDYERFLGLQLLQASEGEDDLVIDAYISPFNNIKNDILPDAVN